MQCTTQSVSPNTKIVRREDRKHAKQVLINKKSSFQKGFGSTIVLILFSTENVVYVVAWRHLCKLAGNISDTSTHCVG